MAKFNTQQNGSIGLMESSGNIPGGSGIPGPQGPAGPKGNDGFSPIVEVTDIEGGHQVVITDATGPHFFVVKNGKDGEAAGFGEVIATVDDNIGIPEVIVTTSGPNTAKNFNFEFKNIKGEKGDEGPTGSNGEKGEPGYSPTVEVTNDEGEHTVTITDAEGPHEFTVRDGEKGDKGDPGSPVAEISGLYGFTVTDESHLVVGYTGKEPPPFKLRDGHLIAEMPHEMDLGNVKGHDGSIENNTYSTNEMVIGTWIDGKKLYRKVLKVKSSSVVNTEQVIANIPNVSSFVRTSGYVVSSAGNFMPINMTNPKNPQVYAIYTIFFGNGDVYQTVMSDVYADKDCILILEYTKTID